MRAAASRWLGAVGRLPLLSALIRQPSVSDWLQKIPGGKTLCGNGWQRIHPFDRVHGTDTSGLVPAGQLPAGEAARVHAVCYAGSQPSILRTALAALPPVDACTFLDLGCGKGRALLVATEYPFRAILGVELSPPLAAIARRNADLMARRHPQRTAVRIAVADASTYPLPAGDLVIFLYHPFGAELVAKVAAAVAAALASAPRSVYVIYYNPVAGHCFDALPVLRRRFSRTLPYAPEECGYGPDPSDPLVIWQGGGAPPPVEAADARIVLVAGGGRVTLEQPSTTAQ